MGRPYFRKVRLIQIDESIFFSLSVHGGYYGREEWHTPESLVLHDTYMKKSIGKCQDVTFGSPVQPETTGRRRVYVLYIHVFSDLVFGFEGSDTLAFFHKPGPGPRGEGVNFIVCEPCSGELVCREGVEEGRTVFKAQADCEPLDREKCPCPHTDIRSCA